VPHSRWAGIINEFLFSDILISVIIVSFLGNPKLFDIIFIYSGYHSNFQCPIKSKLQQEGSDYSNLASASSTLFS
jgi:hypothetical protein